MFGGGDGCVVGGAVVAGTPSDSLQEPCSPLASRTLAPGVGASVAAQGALPREGFHPHGGPA